MSDKTFMELALEQAREAAACGEVPVGAVVVRNGVVVAVGRNAPVHLADPTAHAEMSALRNAALALGNYRLTECELFVTLEPCAMCSGAMLAARLKRVVFGATEPKTGAAGSVIDLFGNRRINHQTVVHGGVLAEESSALLRKFFRGRRAEQRELARQSHPLRDDALRTPDAAFADLPDYPWTAHYLSDLPSLAGLRLHYLDQLGDGGEMQADGAPCLTYLCLHDSFGWSHVFRALIPILLAAGHRVVAPDLVGFGKSDKPKKQSFHDLGRHRQVLVEFVERLDLRNIVLVMPGQGTLLGFSLPMAAASRYRGLGLMSSEQPHDTVVFPLSEGLTLLKKTESSGFDASFLTHAKGGGASETSVAAKVRRSVNAATSATVTATDVERFWADQEVSKPAD